MFLTFNFRSFVEELIRRQDKSTDSTIKLVQEYANRVIEAKEKECEFYRREINALRESAEKERNRADMAVDRLLIRDAKVAPIEAMMRGEAEPNQSAIEKELKAIFDQTAGVGEDGDEEPDKNVRVEVAGVPIEHF